MTVGGVASAAHAPVDLGTAGSFAVLAGQTVTNTGESVIDGDLGLSPGSAVTGFPPGIMTGGGVQYVENDVALNAQAGLTTAYNDAASRSSSGDVADGLGGKTLVDGTYTTAEDMDLTGTVTLDAQGNPNAVFIFQAGSKLTTASNSTVALVNEANPCNVFWQVGSSATLGTNTDFVGTVMAMASISALTGTDVQGRLLARSGSVTLDNNTITAPDCDEPTTTTTSAPPSTEPSDSTTPTTSPTDSTTPTTPTTTETEPSTSVPTTPTTTVTNGLPIIPIPIPIPLLPPGSGTPGGPDQPPADGGQPPSGPGQPPVNGGQPPVAQGQPPVIAGQPPTGGGYIVPKGYPDTGAGGTAAGSSPLKANALVAALVALTLLGSGIAAGQAFHVNRRLK